MRLLMDRPYIFYMQLQLTILLDCEYMLLIVIEELRTYDVRGSVSYCSFLAVLLKRSHRSSLQINNTSKYHLFLQVH